jgi:DNA-binding response OmpR family regulator
MKIYIVEDEEEIRQEVKRLLNQYGYEVKISITFENIKEDIIEYCPDLILMDVNIPYKDGCILCEEIKKTQNIPVIMLTAQNSPLEEVMSFKAGAEDFIAKPYHPQVLLAHIEAVLKRCSGEKEHPQDKINYKGMVLDRRKGVLIYEESQVELSKNELKILNLLMTKPGEIIEREELMEELWQAGEFVDENTLNVNIGRVRKRLEEIGMKDALETKRSMGYRLWVS